MFEERKELTVGEFKGWLVGLIRGKGGELPNLDDWKKIKEMLDKVQDTIVIKNVEPQTPFRPAPYNPIDPYRHLPYEQRYPWEKIGDTPYPPLIWCSDGTGEFDTNMGTCTVTPIADSGQEIITSMLELFKDWKD